MLYIAKFYYASCLANKNGIIVYCFNVVLCLICLLFVSFVYLVNAIYWHIFISYNKNWLSKLIFVISLSPWIDVWSTIGNYTSGRWLYMYILCVLTIWKKIDIAVMNRLSNQSSRFGNGTKLHVVIWHSSQQ